jgi:transposase
MPSQIIRGVDADAARDQAPAIDQPVPAGIGAPGADGSALPGLLIIGGVDTHAGLHQAAAIDERGRLLGTSAFPATSAGYAAMLAWLRGFGRLAAVGVEGTGAYGAGLARHLHAEAVSVLEVPRPERRARRERGKSDALDAELAARAVVAGTASGLPKLATGPIEAIRVLRSARVGAVKAKTAATNALQAMLVTAPEPLRSQLGAQSVTRLISACLALRADPTRLAEPLQATKAALRSLARRARALEREAAALKRQLGALIGAHAPLTGAIFALGPDTAAALLVSIGDNPDRLRHEAAFARLCGVAPIPASSGKVVRHRLHRGGDRSANRALHLAVVVRLRYCEKTRAYAARRRAEGRSMPEIIRCLKRYLAREVFIAIRADFLALST